MKGVLGISLDLRLLAAAELVENCSICADVGTDHGKLGAYLLQHSRCEKVTMTDISDNSLSKAQRLIHDLGLQQHVRFAVGDGLKPLLGDEECIVIAGMGSETICHILESDKRFANATFVLQANVDANKLRAYLTSHGYCIIDEKLAKDGRRYYPLICARTGSCTLTEEEILVGPVLLKNPPPDLRAYLQWQQRVAQKALNGARMGNAEGSIQLLEKEISIRAGVLKNI